MKPLSSSCDRLRSVWAYLFACVLAFALFPARAQAQSLERDAVTVPVAFQAKFHAEGDSSFLIDIYDMVTFDAAHSGTAWVESSVQTFQLKPGQDYIFSVRDRTDVGDIILQLDAPEGYRIYFDDQLRSRGDISETPFTIRVEAEAIVPAGQASSLRPGRVVWSVGVGHLMNGRPAGEISLREQDMLAAAYTPAALVYDNSSPDVERIFASGALRQVYGVSCLVDITTDNDHAFRLKFYPRASGYIEGKSGDLYTLSVGAVPLYEYLVENPEHPTTGKKLRITRIAQQSGTLTTWTEMEKLGTSPNYYYTVVDWVEKPSGATTVTGPVFKLTQSGTWGGSYTNWTDTKASLYATIVATDRRSYQNFSWGSEMTSRGNGSEYTSFNYSARRLSQTTPQAQASSYTSYYSDFDRNGRLYRSFKPFGETAANSSNAAVAEVTTYDYEADWTGRKRLLKSSETKIDNVVAAKSEIAYTYETLVDSSRTYASPPVDTSTMNLTVATQKSYYDATHYLTTVTKTFREDSDPINRFFPGMPHSVKNPDGTMTMNFYYRGTFDPDTRVFTVSTSGAGMLKLAVQGTSVSTGGTALSTFALDGSSATGLPQTFPSGHVFYIVPNLSTAQAVALGADGTVIATIDYVYAGTSPAWKIIKRDVHHYTASLLLQRTIRDSGNTSVTWDIVNNTWTKGRIDYTVDETGIRTDFTYDSVGRVETKTRQGVTYSGLTIPAQVTTYTYDAASRVLTETMSASGTSETLVTTRTYDVGGRILTETKPGYVTSGSSTASAVTTTNVYATGSSSSNRLITTTLPSGSTRIEECRLDGGTKSITGTGVVAEYHALSVESNGQRKVTKYLATGSNARKAEAWTDWLGREAKRSRPGFTGQAASEETNVYDDYIGSDTGRRLQSTKTGYATTRYEYNTMSLLVRSGMDIDGVTGLQLGSASDRIADTSSVFEEYDSALWATTTTSNYPTSSSLTAKVVGKARKRLTGLTATLRSETRTYDAEGNETRVTLAADISNKLVTSTTVQAGMAVDLVEKSLNGLPIEARGHDNLTILKRYDALGRPTDVIEPRTAGGTNRSIKTIYHPNTTWAKEMKDPADKRLSLAHYDGAGRVIYTEDALGKTTRTAYTARGEVDKVWGTATYPVSYVYNSYGERTNLRTYRDATDASVTDTTSFPSVGAYDETTWTFDGPSGLLHKKTDAKGKFVEYSYNVRGQTYERFWSRLVPGSSPAARVKATFAYDSATGENTGITYNDGTPTIGYTYTRSGQPKTVTDVIGAREFVYDSSSPWRHDYEDLTKDSTTFYGSRRLTRAYDAVTDSDDGTLASHTLGTVKGRTAGLKLGSSSTPADDLEFLYPISNTGFVAGIISKRGNGSVSRTFTYGYESQSTLLKSLAIAGSHPYTITREFEPYRDLITSVEAKWSTVSRTKYAYVYDDRRQRESVVQTGDVFNDYGGSDNGAIHKIFTYNGRSELTGAATFLGATATDQSQPLSARKHEFSYDGIGNRRWSNTSGNSTLRDDYTVNELNQYVLKENNTLAVGGTVANDTIKVAAGDAAPALAGRRGRHWGDNVALENWVTPFCGNLNIHAINTSTNQKTTITRTAFLPPAAQAITYDEDGNITNDRVWTYSWDAENRLYAMETTANAVAGGMTARRLEFKYDSLHRRVEKVVRSNWNGLAYQDISTRRYLYDGWNLLVEFEYAASTLTILRSFTWGLDIARSMTDAGGVGGLLQIVDHASSATYLPAYDGNGNVAALMDTGTGDCVAAYEYDAFGGLLRCEGIYAKSNPFRHATKYFDDETGLYCYQRRYYDPRLGRWLTRDPIEERGGLLLYGFVGNNPINIWDVLGLCFNEDRNPSRDYYDPYNARHPNYPGDGPPAILNPDPEDGSGGGWGGSKPAPTANTVNILANANIISVPPPAEGEVVSNPQPLQLSDAQRANLVNALNTLRDSGGPLGKAFYDDVISGRVQIQHTAGAAPSGAPVASLTGPQVGFIVLDLNESSFYSATARAAAAERAGITVDALNQQAGFNGAVIMAHELGHAVLGLSDFPISYNVALVENTFIRPALGLDPRTAYRATSVPTDLSAIPRELVERVYRYAGLTPPPPPSPQPNP